MSTNNDIAMIQSYIDNNYHADDSLSIAQKVHLYMLEESIEVTNDNIDNAIQDVYFK